MNPKRATRLELATSSLEERRHWSAPSYLTSDIDLLMPTDQRIDARLQELGFRRRGRYWQHPDSGVLLEVPGSFLRDHERTEEIELASGRQLLLLSPEDALVYRLHEFVATGHSDAFAQALLLLAAPGTTPELLDADRPAGTPDTSAPPAA